MVINETMKDTSNTIAFSTRYRPLRTVFLLCSLLTATCYLNSCSFDYGTQDGGDTDLPDIVMEIVEYVRVRAADPQARLQADRVARFEERRIMELHNFSFEQFGNRGDDINAIGKAGRASFEIDTGDIYMDDGVRIEVESEDISIETHWLQWKDEDRILSSGDEEEVFIYQEDGTVFSGTGFHANARYRTWEFTGGVGGTYIYEDEEEEIIVYSIETTVEELENDPEEDDDDNGGESE